MSMKPSRFVIPSGTDLTLDPDVLPYVPGRTFIEGKTPRWRTQVNEATSGRETRRKIWTYPRWKFQINNEFLRNPATMSQSELVKILAFFNMHAGGYQEFFYMDDEDKSVEDMPFAVGNGVRTSYQMTRTMSVGTITFTEPVRGFYGTPVVKLNGTPTVAFTMGEYGNIIFNTAPGNGVVITWTGQFFFCCRFDDSEATFEQMFSRIWAGGSPSFTSVKP